MKEQKNWAYGMSINGVGTVYYGRGYFSREGIIDPRTAAPYTRDEIASIVNGAKEGAEGYVFDLPENAVLGMNGFWYDAEGAAAITGHADPLVQDINGIFTAADGKRVAEAMAR